jgi:hypothetical protein
MIVNPIVKKVIQEGEDSKLWTSSACATRKGWWTSTRTFASSSSRGDIDKQTAIEVSTNPEQFKMLLKESRCPRRASCEGGFAETTLRLFRENKRRVGP